MTWIVKVPVAGDSGIFSWTVGWRNYNLPDVGPTMKFNISIISRTIVYFGLFITSSYILIIGPVKEVLKNNTRLEETILHIGGNFHTTT